MPVDAYTLLHGDCLELLRTLPDNSVDAVVTDPPYGLSFMGKKWDYDVPSEDIWRECLRVLKPGGHLLAFAGTRTQHRMAVRIEDAGFEIRDMIAWVYGSGFPKSLDVSKAIDKAAGVEREVLGYTENARPNRVGKETKLSGAQTIGGEITAPATDAARRWSGWGTALKPALEPITVARKPLVGTVAENALEHGTGAINVDGCRVGTDGGTRKAGEQKFGWDGSGTGASIRVTPINAGRWPANLIHDGSEEVVELLGSAARFFACFPRKSNYGGEWQDQNPQQPAAQTATSTLSLQEQVACIAQKAAAIWPSLGAMQLNAQSEPFTPVTPSESKAIDETAMRAIATIANGFLRDSQQERHTPCGSLAVSAVTLGQTGTTTITVSLSRLGGFVGSATSSITPLSLGHGEAGCRIKYCAKASKADRDEGCEGLCVKDVHRYGAGIGEGIAPSAPAKNRNHHPTVKPTDLMRYLCRLVTPPGGVVLDPFMGSGSTGKAAILEGFRFIGCEREAEYLDIARARIEAVVNERAQELPLAAS
jgi:DNA modification methylase